MVLLLGQWLCEVERFDPQTNQWSMIAPMHHSRTGVAVTALKGNGHDSLDYVLCDYSRTTHLVFDVFCHCR